MTDQLGVNMQNYIFCTGDVDYLEKDNRRFRVVDLEISSLPPVVISDEPDNYAGPLV